MGLEHYRTWAQWARYTIGLGHNGPGTIQDWDTMGLGHNRPGTWYWDNNWALLHYRTWTQLASNSVILGHNGPATLQDWDTLALQHYTTWTQWAWYIMGWGQEHNGTGTQWAQYTVGETQWAELHWDTIGLVGTQWDGAGNTTMGLEHKMRPETQRA